MSGFKAMWQAAVSARKDRRKQAFEAALTLLKEGAAGGLSPISICREDIEKAAGDFFWTQLVEDLQEWGVSEGLELREHGVPWRTTIRFSLQNQLSVDFRRCNCKPTEVQDNRCGHCGLKFWTLPEILEREG